MRGSGQATACQTWIELELLASSKIAPGQYAGEQPLHGSFVATENFYYVRKHLSLPLVGDIEATRDAARDVCRRNQTLSADEAAVESGTADVGKPNECFALSYMAA